MRKHPRLQAGVLLLAWASSTAVLSSDAGTPAVDFELSNGQHFVRLADLPAQITVINFWRHDCPACLREMPTFARQTKLDGNLVVTVALHRPAEDALAPEAVRAALTALKTLYGPSDPRGLLARFGNPTGALPHTVILDTAHRLCLKRTGEVDATWLSSAIEHCKNPVR